MLATTLAAAAAATLASLALAQAPAPTILSVDAAKSSLGYAVVHKLHKANAESKEVEGKVAVSPDGRVQVMVRAPIASFKSGDGNRDEHMAEVLETSRYSHVTFKGVGQVAVPQAFPATTEVALQGQLEFHGRKRAEAVKVSVAWTSATEARATAAFDVSLDAYEVERPSLFFIKIEDRCSIGVDLALKAEPAK